MAITYRVLNDSGEIQTQNPDGSWVTPILNPYEQKAFDAKVWRWADLAYKNQVRTGVLMWNTLGVIDGESGGDPHLLGHDPGGSTGLGLMMITDHSAKQGHTDEEVMDPELNIALGVDVLAGNMARIGGVPDLPKMASMYNAGALAHGPHPDPSAPWGYHEYKIPKTGEHPYITRVVRASNYALSKGYTPPEDAGSDSGTTSGAGEILAGFFGGTLAGFALYFGVKTLRRAIEKGAFA